ncbi:MAG: hypothetical protein SangKO_099150 [Sandaracinaceae bacterium]
MLDITNPFIRRSVALLGLAALFVLPARLTLAQSLPPTGSGDLPGVGLAQDDPLTALSILADTSDAGLRVERARLGLAQSELRAVTGWRRLRPAADFFVSMSTRGLAFPSISSQGYDPQYAAIARWPGDTWGVTLSWSIDQILDRRPVDRARNAVDVAHARIDLYQARREQRQAQQRERVIARAERDAEKRERDEHQRRRADLGAQQLRIEAGYLAQRVEAQQELTRLAQMKYDQGDLDYEGLARQRLALLSAKHAQATNAARLATLDAGGGVDVALRDVASPVETTAAPRPSPEKRASSAQHLD